MAKSTEDIKQLAVATLEKEADAVRQLANYITDDFVEVVKLVAASKGRVVVTGIGKSAIIASKIVATLNSTGTPAIFLHAGDAIHGDIGIIQPEDVVVCISKSGSTPEINVLVPLLKNLGGKLVGLVGNTDSYLAKQADYVLNATVSAEACPNNLAPTSSTTAQMALGDALAVCLLDYKGFSDADFARFHPGGSLGKKLYLKVADIYINNESPRVSPDADIKSVIMEISSKRLGLAAVVNGDVLAGVITDGDIRRMLEQDKDIKELCARDIMTVSPKTIAPDTLAVKALNLMEDNNITQLVVADGNTYLGIVHLHDLLKEGLV